MLSKYNVCVLSLFIAGFVGGCVSPSGKDTLLRSGYADLDTGNLKGADKKARRILKDWHNNHSAELLRAEAAAKAGQTKKAVDIIVHLDYQCRKDMCENETAHINALMLLTTLTQDEDILRKSQEKIEELKKKITVRQHGNLVDFYSRQGVHRMPLEPLRSLRTPLGAISLKTRNSRDSSYIILPLSTKRQNNSIIN